LLAQISTIETILDGFAKTPLSPMQIHMLTPHILTLLKDECHLRMSKDVVPPMIKDHIRTYCCARLLKGGKHELFMAISDAQIFEPGLFRETCFSTARKHFFHLPLDVMGWLYRKKFVVIGKEFLTKSIRMVPHSCLEQFVTFLHQQHIRITICEGVRMIKMVISRDSQIPCEPLIRKIALVTKLTAGQFLLYLRSRHDTECFFFKKENLFLMHTTLKFQCQHIDALEMSAIRANNVETFLWIWSVFPPSLKKMGTNFDKVVLLKRAAVECPNIFGIICRVHGLDIPFFQKTLNLPNWQRLFWNIPPKVTVFFQICSRYEDFLFVRALCEAKP
jgi:hypothetical protein